MPVADPAARGEIENLIARYAELIDDGDFAGVGALLGNATFVGSGGPVRGASAIEQMYVDMLFVYDGTPKTKHLITNLIIEIDTTTDAATARSSFTAFQALPELPLQAIVSGRYRDRFRLIDGRWAFSERRVQIDLVGDVSKHLRPR
jgi:3-phenylpropionate/cinnamic acid dioxygenase small subunit